MIIAGRRRVNSNRCASEASSYAQHSEESIGDVGQLDHRFAGHCPPSVETCWQLRGLLPFCFFGDRLMSFDMRARTWQSIQGSKGAALQRTHNKRNKLSVKGTKSIWDDATIRREHENTDLSWSHGLHEHWHCFSGLTPSPQLTVLMRQGHTWKKKAHKL